MGSLRHEPPAEVSMRVWRGAHDCAVNGKFPSQVLNRSARDAVVRPRESECSLRTNIDCGDEISLRDVFKHAGIGVRDSSTSDERDSETLPIV